MKVKLIDKMGWFKSSPANSYLYKKLFIPGDIVACNPETAQRLIPLLITPKSPLPL